MAHGAVQQDKQQVPHADDFGPAAADKTNDTEGQGKNNYSIAPLHGGAVFKHRFDAVLDASSTIIMIKMPFLHLRGEMGHLRKAMDKASVEYDQ
jgi:hypothetical protein